MNKPTQSSLKRLITYNPLSGEFQRIARLTHKGEWKPYRSTPRSTTKYGYLQLNIFGRPYMAHRLAFLYMLGRLPSHDVDHINGDRSDNRWCNLREVDRGTNLRNIGVKSNSTTGVLGVSWRKDTGKYQAYIDYQGHRERLGCHKTLYEAKVARLEAERRYGFHENHGKRPAWVN